MIRILHLRDAESFGGPEKTIQESVRLGGGEEFSYEVALFVSHDRIDAFAGYRDLCELTELDPARVAFPSQVERVRRIVRERGVSILHTHDLKTRVLARCVGLGVHVSTAHGHIQTGWKSRLRNSFDRWMMHSADRLLAVSEAMSQDFALQGIESAVVRNCIVLDRYPYGYRSSEFRSHLGWTCGERVLGCVGRLSAEKGQAGVIRAVARLRESWADLRVVFVGDGPDRSKLEGECRRAGLTGVIRFVGHHPNMLEVYGGLDALILNSRSEGLPNVVLEALALGVPVIATSVGGTPEVIRDGVDGILYEQGDEEALIRAVGDVFGDRDGTQARGVSGRARVEAEFPMQRLVDATHTIYRRALAEAVACGRVRPAVGV